MASNNSVSLHRVLTTTPEKLYRAFTEAAAIASWLPPYGYVCTVHEQNVEVNGTYKMSFQNFSTQHVQSFGGTYLELRPNEFIRYTDRFDDAHLPGDMMTSICITKVSVGTELRITQENIPPMIPAEACYLGWQQSLEKLAKLVGPDIPDMQ